MSWNLILDTLSQGLLYGILAIGVMVTYRILDFPDLSVDSTMPLGGVVAAMTITGIHQPLVALLTAFVAGCMAGALTGVLHVHLRISPLLSGIMMMTGLYSINRMIGSSSNIPLYQETTLFSVEPLLKWFPDLSNVRLLRGVWSLVVMLVAVVLVKKMIDWLLTTQYGYLIRMTGDNPELVGALGEDVGRVKIFSLALSNGIVGLFGAVSIQYLGYYDLQMGTGMIAAGLASVILGVTLCRKLRMKETTMVVIGAVIYRFAIALAYRLNAPTSSEKLITVGLFLFAIVIGDERFRKKRKESVK